MSISAATKTQNPDKHNEPNHDQPHLGLYADFLIRALAWLIDFLILTLAKSILAIFIGVAMISVGLSAFLEAQKACNFSSVQDDEAIITVPIFREQLLPREDDQEKCVQTIINLTTQTSSFFVVLTTVLFTIVQWLYYAISESSNWQASPGKLILGLKVVDTNFQKISFARASGRHFAKLLSLLCLGFGYLMPLFTERKQALHDLVANCVIVKNNLKTS
jgi:uncharacterized RDD family membrane protein YckC